MAPIRGTRSTRDAISWTCKAGYLNQPKECLLFDIPSFICGCKCGEQFDGDFDFCMGDIEVNKHNILGVPLLQVGPNCVAFAYTKLMEITKRMKAIIEGKDPNLLPVLYAHELVDRFEELMVMGDVKPTGLHKVFHMAQILKEEGMTSHDKSRVHKVSDVSTICRDQYEAIVYELANGYPLHAGLLVGKHLRNLQFCTIYKPPQRNRFFQKKRKVKAHSVLLVGAGRKKGRWFYYFLNSWKSFCVRSNSTGAILRSGIGKVQASMLNRNVVRLSRFKEKGNPRSLEHQNDIELSATNLRLLLSSV